MNSLSAAYPASFSAFERSSCTPSAPYFSLSARKNAQYAVTEADAPAPSNADKNFPRRAVRSMVSRPAEEISFFTPPRKLA